MGRLVLLMFKQVRRLVSRWWLLGIILLVAGCVFGPFEIVHEDGHMPKGRVNLTDNCKFRINKKIGRVVCDWEIDNVFSIASNE